MSHEVPVHREYEFGKVAGQDVTKTELADQRVVLVKLGYGEDRNGTVEPFAPVLDVVERASLNSVGL